MLVNALSGKLQRKEGEKEVKKWGQLQDSVVTKHGFFINTIKKKKLLNSELEPESADWYIQTYSDIDKEDDWL